MFSWGSGRLEGCRGGGLSSPSCSLLKMRVTAGITQTAPQKSKAVPGLALPPKMLIGEMQTTNSATWLAIRGEKGNVFRALGVWAFTKPKFSEVGRPLT